MTDKFKDIIEKYNPSDIFAPIEENYDVNKIRAGSFVVIDPTMLENKEIKDKIITTKGKPYFAQLKFLADKKEILYVAALKAFRSPSGYLSVSTQSTTPDEADLVIHRVPGLYSSPISVPVSILSTDTNPGDIMQKPIPDDYNARQNIDKGSTLDNEYIKGKQPKGTVNNP